MMNSKDMPHATLDPALRRCGHRVFSALPAELPDAPIVLGVTGLNAWGRAGTWVETVMEASLASGTGVLREQNFSVLHFRARRIRLSPRAARDGGERQKRCERFHLRPPIRCLYGEAILLTYSSLETERKSGKDQLRWTRQVPPAARSLEHSVSAASRVCVATRMRCQIAALPSIVRTTTGSRPPRIG